MLPDHIIAEIAERMQTASPAQLHELARTVGIDPEAALAPRPTVEEVAKDLHPIEPDGDVYVGAIESDLVEALGKTVRHRCRVVYKAALSADEDCRTGEPVRILGAAAQTYQRLRWKDPDKIDGDTRHHLRGSSPVWETADLLSVIPEGALLRLDDLVEEQALEQERAAGKSNP